MAELRRLARHCKFKTFLEEALRDCFICGLHSNAIQVRLTSSYFSTKNQRSMYTGIVINTHRGLFRYNRLPFGVASAPGIFRRVMESLLSGIPGVVVYNGDILIIGETETDHLATLEEVLKRLENVGL